MENVEDDSFVFPRSVKCDPEKNNLASKLDDMFKKFETIENVLKDFQSENKKYRLVITLIY